MQLPARSFGILRLMVSALVVSLRPRYPFLRLPAPHASSVWASMTSLMSDSAITLMSWPCSLCRRRIWALSPAISRILSMWGYCLSSNPDSSN